MSPARHQFAFIAVCLALLAAAPASASPWVLPDGVAVFQLTSGTDFASKEYLPDGTLQEFPLNGNFESYYFQIDGRYGLGKGFDLGLRTQFKGISYTSDSVLLFEGDPSNMTDDQLRNSVFSFSQSALGLADLNVSLSYQHLGGAFRLASVLDVKLPTGYDQPQSTFVDDVADPSQLGDDVTLGDGQLDVLYALQAGIFIPQTLTLFEASAAYNARFNGPGHQGLAELKIGQALDEHLFFFAAARGALTLFEGESLGEGLVARDPSVPAQAFTGDNVKVIELTLDRDYLVVEGGAILRFSGREILLRVSHTVLAANFPQLTGVSLGTLLVFD